MTWEDLQSEGRADKHQTSREELNDLRKAVRRNLHDAGIRALSADNRFGLAYEAGLILAKMGIACAGYRIKGQGAHQATFAALMLAVGPGAASAAAYLDRCRRKRNQLSYEAAGIVSETEADELLSQVLDFQKLVEAWIKEHYPRLTG